MHTRRIFIKNLVVPAFIGILEHEIEAQQALHIDAEFDTLFSAAPDDHDIASVLDYRLLRQSIIDEITRAHTYLLETLIERIAERIQNEFPCVERVKLRLSKPQAFADCDAVGIEIERTRSR